MKSQKLTDLKSDSNKKLKDEAAEEEEDENEIEKRGNDKKKQYMLSIMGDEDQKIFKK